LRRIDARPIYLQEIHMSRTIAVLAAAIAVNFAVAVPAGAATPEERAQEAASEGAQSLRSFVHRTRMIYALNIYDFSAASDEAGEAPDASLHGPSGDALRLEREHAEVREQIYRDMLHE
jgi:hypothetical protein